MLLDVIPWLPIATSKLSDRWVISELNDLVRTVTGHLDVYNPTDAGRRIEEFVDLLSNWYVRRSRRRFWRSESDDDKTWAHAVLYSCLTGRPPFHARSMLELLAQVTTTPPTSPREIRSEIPADLEAICLTALRITVCRAAMSPHR